MAAQVERHRNLAADNSSSAAYAIENTKILICALNFISRNLPLPQEVFDAVSDIYHNSIDDADVRESDDDAINYCESSVNDDVEKELRSGVGDAGEVGKISEIEGDPKFSSYGDLMAEFENAVSQQRPSCMSGVELTEAKKKRFQSLIKHRLAELEELPASRGDDLQSKCLLELYGLKLAELQNKVRIEVASEYLLRLLCANPEKQLFDWGMTRLPRPMYGIADAFGTGSGDPLKKKRDAERLSRLEEEERNRMETRKKQFFADVLNAARELQLQVQASQKRRKQRNDGVHVCTLLFLNVVFVLFLTYLGYCMSRTKSVNIRHHFRAGNKAADFFLSNPGNDPS
ncbi:hypothetical protein Leryth_003754 [Lithospermum erythrorhizon]|nr:hypothetical protein Leryth_003754 [Lithospermum erythrorhizon]